MRFFFNHKAPHYIGCPTFSAEAERRFCQHIKLTAFFHYKSHPRRRVIYSSNCFDPAFFYQCCTVLLVHFSFIIHRVRTARSQTWPCCAHLSAGLAGLQGRPAHGFAGCLRRACICMAASRAAAGAGTDGEEVFINVCWYSRENLMDRTAVVPRLRQCNKETPMPSENTWSVSV